MPSLSFPLEDEFMNNTFGSMFLRMKFAEYFDIIISILMCG